MLVAEEENWRLKLANLVAAERVANDLSGAKEDSLDDILLFLTRGMREVLRVLKKNQIPGLGCSGYYYAYPKSISSLRDRWAL